MAADPWFIRQFDGPARYDSDTPYTTVTNEPPASWRPFSADSAWNTPISANPTLDPNSSAIIGWLNSLLPTGGPTDRYCGGAGTVEDYDHPVYYAKRTDPLLRVLTRKGQFDPSTTRVRRLASSLHNRLIPVPANSPESMGTDRHLTIVVGDTAYDMWGARRDTYGPGYLGTAWGTVVPLGGDGSTEGGYGATAVGCPLMAGIIRLSELESGHINHALAITTRYVRHDTFVAPATGTALGDPGVTKGSAEDMMRPQSGARLQLDMSFAEIDALAVRAWKKTMLKAMSEYGMIIVDTAGTNTSYTPILESGAPDVAAGQVDRWKLFAQSQGWSPAGSSHVMPLSSGVDWSKLRVVTM